MAITLKEVNTKSDLKKFIYLPEKIHKNHKNWLPPIYMDEKKFFNPAKNLSFRGCDYRLIMAYKDNIPVGRIMGIIHHQHNELFNIKNVRFCFMECYNDPEVFHALISDIEDWGRQLGMNKIIGPFGFTDREIQGFLIKGFEYEPVIDSACNFEYMPELLVKEGYEKELDCKISRFPLSNQLPDIFEKIYERVTSKKDFQFLEYTSRKQLKNEIVPAFKTMNEAFGHIYGFMPMDEKEMTEFAHRYLSILDPRFIKIVKKGDEVAAFLVCMPNMYKGIQRARGRLFPFGIFHILYAMKRAKSVNTMLGAVKPEYQKKGLDIFLGIKIIESTKKAKMTSVDTHVVMDDNSDMTAVLNRYGAFEIKRFRVFQKHLV
jgi:hypothetical protein